MLSRTIAVALLVALTACTDKHTAVPISTPTATMPPHLCIEYNAATHRALSTDGSEREAEQAENDI